MAREPGRDHDVGSRSADEVASESADEVGPESIDRLPEGADGLQLEGADAPQKERREAASSEDATRRVADIGLALDLGIRLGVSVILGLGIGLLVDGWAHTTPIFTLLGMLLGIAAAMYTIWDVAREAMRR